MNSIDGPERKFLHELSNPISTLSLLVEVAHDDSAKTSGTESPETQALAKCLEVLGRIRRLIEARREFLIRAGGQPPSA